MNEDRFIHIISFDIPYPADYGGVIDVFYKIKYLHQQGVKVILHCFQYKEKNRRDELEKYCEKVHYYERDTSYKKHLSLLPYTVKSRINKELLSHLLKDNYPVLFETLHAAYYMHHPLLRKRKKILRLSNIEHHYYYNLFKAEKKCLKKMYFLVESVKLYFYEKKAFKEADIILPVTKSDDDYIKKYYSKIKTDLIPSFHPYNDMSTFKGSGRYLLYHGNLGIAENYKAAAYLIDHIAGKVNYSIVIAGKNPPKFLYQKARQQSNIQIVSDPDEEEMKQLIQNAHIVWLYTHQATGLKLKLICSLYTARFILCNDKMLGGTKIKPNHSLYVENNTENAIETIEYLKTCEFDDIAISHRQELLVEFENKINLEKLLKLI